MGWAVIGFSMRGNAVRQKNVQQPLHAGECLEISADCFYERGCGSLGVGDELPMFLLENPSKVDLK